MSFPNEDIKNNLYSESELNEISKKDNLIQEAENKEVSPEGDTQIKSNIDGNSAESFPYEWLFEYKYPETLHNLIINLNMKKEDLLSLPINNFKDPNEVYKAIRVNQKEKYDEWENIMKDDMLRTHALENLITGYNDLNEKFDLIKINSEAQLEALKQVDELMNDILEKGKKEVGQTTGIALELVSGAMKNQIDEFRSTFNEENIARREFFKKEYSELKENLDKAILDSNIKNTLNKTTIFLFIAMIFTQMIFLGLFGYIYKM